MTLNCLWRQDELPGVNIDIKTWGKVRKDLFFLISFVVMFIVLYCYLLYKHQWNTKWTFARKIHIFTREEITVVMVTYQIAPFSLVFIYLTSERSERVRYRVEHSKDKIHIHAWACNIHYILSIFSKCIVCQHFLKELLLFSLKDLKTGRFFNETQPVNEVRE